MAKNFTALRAGLRRFALPAGLLSLTIAAGCDLSSVVRATDPDVILPEFIANAGGAEALRIGTLGRFNAATTGGESMLLYGGLLGDEFTTGDTFTQRVETDQRSLTVENGNISDAFRQLHRVRIGAIQTREALAQNAPNAPAWNRAEMYYVEAMMITMLAEHFCNGQPLSTISNGVENYGLPLATAELYTRALALADSGAALVASSGTGANDVRVRNSLAVLRSRVMTDQGNFAGALAATASVPTSFVWFQEHSLTARTPAVWSLNNNQRRYIVSDAEGPMQIAYVSGNDPRVPACNWNEAECQAAGFTTRRPFDSGNLAVPDMRYQLVFPTDASSVPFVSGLQARLAEAEAQNRLGNFAAALTILNTLRASPPGYGRTIAAMAPLTDPGTPEARRDLIFRERALWLFGLGYRYPDMRRLVRQYNLPQNQVFPSGTWQIGRTPGYGSDVVFPLPQGEVNNPNIPKNAAGQPQCTDRNA